MPLDFILQEEDNGNITFLIRQIYHPFDSLIFIKKKNHFF